jgi:5-methyltetrahydrofolate--homocysteine methyltransferase
MNAAYASDLLLNKEEADVRYIENVKPLSVTTGAAGNGSAGVGGKADNSNAGKTPDSGNYSKLFEDVLKGNKRTIIEDVKAFLAEGNEPQAVIEDHLIPAINEVGVLFDKKKYFLPQLISSAEAMELAISYVEPLLPKKESGEEQVTIVMATVEGDIHDIGKNLVVLMLKNYGYHVIDLGKDVPKEVIVETAIKENAKIIGLSALMTTTMMRMKDVVEYAKEQGAQAKVIIGGAVITQSFADEIGADGYSKDAAEACRLVERLLSE